MLQDKNTHVEGVGRTYSESYGGSEGRLGLSQALKKEIFMEIE